MKNIYIDGLKFGMLLQFAIGPVCLFIFQIAIISGLIPSLFAVLAVTIVDFIFILFAILGVGKLLEKNEKAKKVLKYFGASVLVLFGLLLILSIFKTVNLIDYDISKINNIGAFVSTFILTFSNPLTIIFWTRVFATKIVDKEYNFNNNLIFGLGCVSATFLFLVLISISTSICKSYIPSQFMLIMNFIVGCALVYFGIKSFLKRN